MSTTAEVDAWFAQFEHPLAPIMQRVRALVLGADPRMTELVKYGTVQFEYGGGFAAFVQVRDPKRVSLMFNAAGRLTGSGDFPHLEGKSVKYLRFSSLADVAERQVELETLTRAWCALNAGRA